jgi:hypothetical protein
MPEQEPVGDDNYGDYIDNLMSKGTTDKHLTIVEGQHGEIHFDLSKKQEPPTVEFRPNIVTKPTVPPETQRTFESMRTLLRNGVVALILFGVILVVLVWALIWMGIEQQRRWDDVSMELQRLRTSPGHRSDTENGFIPPTKPGQP